MPLLVWDGQGNINVKWLRRLQVGDQPCLYLGAVCEIGGDVPLPREAFDAADTAIEAALQKSVPMTLGIARMPANWRSGTVPALKLDEGMIPERTGVTESVDNQSDSPVLTGRTVQERPVVHVMRHRIEADLDDAAAACFNQSTPGLGPDIETYQNRGWGEHKRRPAIATMHALDIELPRGVTWQVRRSRCHDGRRNGNGGAGRCRLRQVRNAGEVLRPRGLARVG